MSRTRDNDRVAPRPYLITSEGSGFRLTIRETRYNSQNYPVVTATPVDEHFATASAARTYAKRAFGAVAGQFALQQAHSGESGG